MKFACVPISLINMVMVVHLYLCWLNNSMFSMLKEEKVQCKCMFRVVDDDIESLDRIVPDIFDGFLK